MAAVARFTPAWPNTRRRAFRVLNRRFALSGGVSAAQCRVENRLFLKQIAVFSHETRLVSDVACSRETRNALANLKSLRIVSGVAV